MCRGGRTFDGWLCVLDFQLNHRGQFDADRFAFVDDDLNVIVFLQVQHLVADPFLVEMDLIVCLVVHEDEAVALVVQILHLPAFEVRHLDFIFGLDALDVALEQRAQPALASLVERAVGDAAGLLAHVHEGLAVLVADLQVVTADREVARILDVADPADRLGDQVDGRDGMDDRPLSL